MKEKISRQKSIFNIIFLIFAMVIVIADVCLVLSHDRTFSENENRVLAQLPEFSQEAVVSGKYMEEAESFVTDQFFLRDMWIGMKYRFERALGKTYFNGVYVTTNGNLIEDAKEPDNEALMRNLSAINYFSTTNPELEIIMSVVPNEVSICKDLLPEGANVRNQEEDLNFIRSKIKANVVWSDVRDCLKEHSDEYIYYRSDHHWTSLGAYIAFKEMAEDLNISEKIPNYDIFNVTDDFSGTLASTSGNFGVKDEIELYVPRTDVEYVVEYVSDMEKSATMYKSDALKQKNKYEVFLGGNYPQVNIKSTNANGRNLLLLKDSYANTFVQFLLPFYQSITIIDPRYYSDDLNQLIGEKGISQVLILYNLNTFVTDNSLAGVLR